MADQDTRPAAAEDPAPGSAAVEGGAPSGAGRTPAEGLAAWRKALAENNRAKRNRRGKRPGPEITGVRIPPPSDGAA